MTDDTSSPLTAAQQAASATLGARLDTLETQVLDLQRAVGQAVVLFQDSPGAAFLVTSQGQIVDVNVRGAALLGSTRGLLQGRRLTPSIAPAFHAAMTALLTRVMASGRRQVGELQVLTPRGELLDVVVEAALQQGDGPPVCHLTLTDVTAFKLAHGVLLDAQQGHQAQLQRYGQQLQELQDEFESVVLTSGRELEDTVTRAANFLTLARQHPETPGHLGHVENAIQQTHSLLESLKMYMQIRFLRAHRRHVGLKRVLSEVLKDVQDEMHGRDVRIANDPLPTLYGDSHAFLIILREYVANALKFTRTRPVAILHVRVQEGDSEYRIGVEDNGVGFSMRYKDKLFTLFGRLHHAGQHEGTGLGLVVVRRLCERFGGRAWAEGRPEQGATFWFAWPKAAPDE